MSGDNWIQLGALIMAFVGQIFTIVFLVIKLKQVKKQDVQVSKEDAKQKKLDETKHEERHDKVEQDLRDFKKDIENLSKMVDFRFNKLEESIKEIFKRLNK